MINYFDIVFLRHMSKNDRHYNISFIKIISMASFEGRYNLTFACHVNNSVSSQNGHLHRDKNFNLINDKYILNNGIDLKSEFQNSVFLVGLIDDLLEQLDLLSTLLWTNYVV